MRSSVAAGRESVRLIKAMVARVRSLSTMEFSISTNHVGEIWIPNSGCFAASTAMAFSARMEFARTS